MNINRKIRNQAVPAKRLRIVKGQIQKMKSLIFLTRNPAFKNLDLDVNFLPKLNKKNYQICDAYKQKKYSDGIASCRSEYDGTKSNDWSQFVRTVATVNKTRTPNNTQKEIADHISQHISDIKTGAPDCVDRIFKNADGSINSLVTKIYKWIYFFENGKDAFAIYDSIVKSVLPYYAKQNGVTMPNDVWTNYRKYLEVVKGICGKTGLSLQEFDRILWTFYASNPIQKEIAIALGK